MLHPWEIVTTVVHLLNLLQEHHHQEGIMPVPLTGGLPSHQVGEDFPELFRRAVGTELEADHRMSVTAIEGTLMLMHHRINSLNTASPFLPWDTVTRASAVLAHLQGPGETEWHLRALALCPPRTTPNQDHSIERVLVQLTTTYISLLHPQSEHYACMALLNTSASHLNIGSPRERRFCLSFCMSPLLRWGKLTLNPNRKQGRGKRRDVWAVYL